MTRRGLPDRPSTYSYSATLFTQCRGRPIFAFTSRATDIQFAVGGHAIQIDRPRNNRWDFELTQTNVIGESPIRYRLNDFGVRSGPPGVRSQGQTYQRLEQPQRSTSLLQAQALSNGFVMALRPLEPQAKDAESSRYKSFLNRLIDIH
ncbi:MAG: hypothetical protein CM15mP120_00800 [Pseudomonadota bacterium]|nr:MAG: hypothetical protein CM15mP120_00800 [Pseudomonadota bacterium]